jgi:hypothetical protein
MVDKPDFDDEIEELKHPSDEELEVAENKEAREVWSGLLFMYIAVAVAVIIAIAFYR